MLKKIISGVIALSITFISTTAAFADGDLAQDPTSTTYGKDYDWNKLNDLNIGSIIEDSTKHAGDMINVMVNDNYVIFSEAAPYIDKATSRTMIPIHAVFQNLGAKVDWNGNTNTAIMTKGDKIITIKIGESVAYVNGSPINIDCSATLKEQRTFVPLRFISETFGANVKWDDPTRTVIITNS